MRGLLLIVAALMCAPGLEARIRIANILGKKQPTQVDTVSVTIVSVPEPVPAAEMEREENVIAAEDIIIEEGVEIPDSLLFATLPPLPSAEPAIDDAIIEVVLHEGILGDTQLTVDQMYNYVKRRNSKFRREIAEAYYEVGRRYGIRGDVALCQAIIETGWFRFADGTAVKANQHNYCGLGVTRRGMKGCSFKNVKEGVTAQIQHLYAYSSKEALPKGEKVVDPRFKLVKRGCAKTWHDLSNRWAANANYGRHILKLYAEMAEEATTTP
ncbi:MAG: glucosaminidase domain-containing protein [Bacteroidales bacterium]|nr:glucosaminidase domain-containing protein [Bacteroidales bacterium]